MVRALLRRLPAVIRRRRWVERATTRVELSSRLRQSEALEHVDDSVDGADPDLLGGLPVPPPRLRHLVSGTPDLTDFLTTGHRHAVLIGGAAAAAGVRLGPGVTVADVGCGCGRILRHWVQGGAALRGGDVNRDLIGWVEEHLPVAGFPIGDRPPIGLDDGTVDVLVAYSVLTHLPLDSQRRWLRDWTRVVRPGGLLIVSTHGRSRREELDGHEREQFEDGRAVVRHATAEGDNLCSAFLPASVATDLFESLTVVEHREPAADQPWDQDLWVLRK